MLQRVASILALDTAEDWAVVFMLRSVTQFYFFSMWGVLYTNVETWAKKSGD